MLKRIPGLLNCVLQVLREEKRTGVNLRVVNRNRNWETGFDKRGDGSGGGDVGCDVGCGSDGGGENTEEHEALACSQKDPTLFQSHSDSNVQESWSKRTQRYARALQTHV